MMIQGAAIITVTIITMEYSETPAPCAGFRVRLTQPYHSELTTRCANLSRPSPPERANVLFSFTRQLGEVPQCDFKPV
jgi:hypothetical protein